MQQDSAIGMSAAVDHGAGRLQRTIRLVALTLLLWPLALMPVHAASDGNEADRLAIIQLIEDQLAGAYRIPTHEDTPCFGTLDEIYPMWHKGDPAGARRRWTFHGYQSYELSYLVESITMKNPEQAVAKAVKNIDLSRWVTFFVFPPELKQENFKKKVTIVCRRKPSSAWQILREVVE